MMQEKKYEITLMSETHFRAKALDKDFQTIFQSFCPISYLSNVCHAEIVSRSLEQDLCFRYFAITAQTKESIAYLRKKKQEKKKDYKLQYQIFENVHGQKCEEAKSILQVQFKKQGRQKNAKIVITITDTKGWISEKLNKNIEYIQSTRLAPFLYQQDKEFSYFYKQGENDQKCKKFKNDHYFLVFDWGGLEAAGFLGTMKILQKQLSWDNHLNIKSIIGSELGALIGLGLISKMNNKDLFQEISAQVLKVKSEKHDLTMSGIQKFWGFKNQEKKRFIDILRQLLKDLHPVIWAIQTKQIEDNQQNEKKDKEMNLLGKIIYGAEQKGKIFHNITLKILQHLIKNNQDAKNLGLKPEQITLQKLYSITQVELTLTALDLTDNIIRFLNHKTSPQLPVCQAVRISSTSLMSFQKVEWKKQWGKYFVYHTMTRREIDLTNNQLITGGHSIPYPINYYHDQYVQPTYFSHAVNEHTKVLGFSLDRSHKDYNIHQQRKKKKIRQTLQKVSEFLLEYVKHAEKQKLNIDIFDGKIINKIFQKVKSIAQTFVSGMYNLNKEISRERTVNVKYQAAAEKPQRKNCQQIMIKKNIKYIIEKLENKEETISEEEIVDYIIKLKQIYVPFQVHSEKYKKLQGQFIKKGEQFIEKFENYRKDNLFWSSNLQDNRNTLIKAYQTIYNFFCSQGQLQGYTKTVIQQISINQKTIYDRIKEQLESQLNSQKSQDKYKQKSYLSFQLINNVLNLQKLIYKVDVGTIDQEMKNICENGGPQLQYQYYFSKQQRTIRNFFEQVLISNHLFLKQDSSDDGKIHLVLQSNPLSHLYMIPFFQLVEDYLYFHSEKQSSLLQKVSKKNDISEKSAIKQKNKIFKANNVKITSITASGFNAVSAFLYASDLNSYQLRKSVYKFQRCFKKIEWRNEYQIQETIQKKFNLGTQAQVIFQDIRNFMEKSIQQIFSNRQIDRYNYIVNKMEELEDSCILGLEKLHQIVASFENDYNEKKQDNEKKKDGVKLKSKKELFKQMLKDNINKSDDIKPLKFLIDQFGEDIEDILKVSSYMLEHFLYIKKLAQPEQPGQKKEKHQILNAIFAFQMIHLSSIKTFINQILDTMKLNFETNLKQFYQSSQKKIQLNFSVYQMHSKNIMFLNHNTRPKMPVWAAILASLSLPIFFTPFKDKKQWVYFSDSQAIRHARKDFLGQKNNYEKRKFCSGDFLDKFPMQMLCNKEIQAYNYKKQKKQLIICVCINLEQQKESKNQEKELNRLSAKDLKNMKQLLSFKTWEKLEMLQYFKNIFPSIISPHYKFFTDIYDKSTCKIKSLHFTKLYSQIKEIQSQNISQSQKEKKVKSRIQKYIKKAQISTKQYFRNNPKFIIKKTAVIQFINNSYKIRIQDPQNSKKEQRSQKMKIFNKIQTQQSDSYQELISQKDIIIRQKKNMQQQKKNMQQEFNQKNMKQEFYPLKLKVVAFEGSQAENIQQEVPYYHTLKFKDLVKSKDDQKDYRLKDLKLQKEIQYTFEFIINPAESGFSLLPLAPNKSNESNKDEDHRLLLQSKAPKFVYFTIDNKANKKDFFFQFFNDNQYGYFVDVSSKIKIQWKSCNNQQQQSKGEEKKKQMWKNIDQLSLTGNLNEICLSLKIQYIQKSQNIQLDHHKLASESAREQFNTYYSQISFQGFQQNQECSEVCCFQFNKLQKKIKINENSSERKVELKSIVHGNQNLFQQFLMCPKCFEPKKKLEKCYSQDNCQRACSCCKTLQNILLNCKQCPGAICTSCLFKFKDDDDNPYTCYFCDSQLKIYDNEVSKCSGKDCGKIDRENLIDKNCGYAFCQKCFKNLSLDQK